MSGKSRFGRNPRDSELDKSYRHLMKETCIPIQKAPLETLDELYLKLYGWEDEEGQARIQKAKEILRSIADSDEQTVLVLVGAGAAISTELYARMK